MGTADFEDPSGGECAELRRDAAKEREPERLIDSRTGGGLHAGFPSRLERCALS